METHNPIYFDSPTTSDNFSVVTDLNFKKEDSSYDFMNRRVPRITKILSAVYGNDDYLMNWAASFGSLKSFKMERSKIFVDGTLAHNKIEAFLQNQKQPNSLFESQEATNAFSNFVQWYNDKQSLGIQIENICIEQKTSNPWYGGTMDWYARFYSQYSDRNFIVDFKTSNSIEPKAIIQAYAYYWSLKWNIMNGLSNLPIPNGIGILRIDKHKKAYHELFFDFSDPSTYSVLEELNYSLGSIVNWFYHMNSVKGMIAEYRSKSNIERWIK